MDSKNYTDVLINGKIYTLGGAEEERYLQPVASYIPDDEQGQRYRLPSSRSALRCGHGSGWHP